jgi:ribonuclease Z
MELIFLGTSAAIPTKNRNLSSVAIVIDGEQIIFDVGEDIQRQFEKHH